tara:strand:+ start:283 stop:720 length:438 start_codon:yes stop_codon:yes gene_type:complete
MFFLNKIIKVLLCLTLCLSMPAQAAPQFTLLGKNQSAPFKGALFNPEAIAEVLARSQFTEDQYKLKLGYELEKQELEHTLAIDTLSLRLSSLGEEYKIVVTEKDKEINDLHKLIKNHSPATNIWWTLGGAAVGIATTAFIVHVAK